MDWLAHRLHNLKRLPPDITGRLFAKLTGPQAMVAETVKESAT